MEVTHRCLRSKFSQRPNLNASDIRGKTALIFASSYGHREASRGACRFFCWVDWMLGVLQKSWGRFEDVVVKETGASNAPGWGETESSDPKKIPQTWQLMTRLS